MPELWNVMIHPSGRGSVGGRPRPGIGENLNANTGEFLLIIRRPLCATTHVTLTVVCDKQSRSTD